MTQVNLSDYKNLYIQTAKEYINSLLLGCKKLVSDPYNKDAVNQMHIDSHSLRTQSQAMGFTDIANICLVIEKVSDDALKGIVQLNNKNISEIKKSVEELNEILRQGSKR